MKSTVARRLAVVIVVLAALAAVVVVAYQWGVNNHQVATYRGMTFRGDMFGWGYGPGAGLFGLIGLILVGVLVFWLIAAIVSPDGRSHRPAPQTPGDLERLQNLSDMHTRGELTDDEFSVAKRKLLGLP